MSREVETILGVIFLILAILCFLLARRISKTIEDMPDEDKEVYEDIEAYEKELKDNPDWASEIYGGWDETISPVYTPMEWVAGKEKKSEKMG